MLHGKEAEYSILSTIGARVLVHIKQYVPKVQDKAWEGKLVGYYNDSKEVRLYNPDTNRVMESRIVTFIETPPYNIRSAGDEGDHFWGDVIKQASMLKPPDTFRVSPPGLIHRQLSEVAGSTERA